MRVAVAVVSPYLRGPGERAGRRARDDLPVVGGCAGRIAPLPIVSIRDSGMSAFAAPGWSFGWIEHAAVHVSAVLRENSVVAVAVVGFGMLVLPVGGG